MTENNEECQDERRCKGRAHGTIWKEKNDFFYRSWRQFLGNIFLSSFSRQKVQICHLEVSNIINNFQQIMLNTDNVA